MWNYWKGVSDHCSVKEKNLLLSAKQKGWWKWEWRHVDKGSVHHTVYRHSEQCRHMLPSILNEGGSSSRSRNPPSALRQMRVNLPGLLGVKIAHFNLLSCTPAARMRHRTHSTANWAGITVFSLYNAIFHKKIKKVINPRSCPPFITGNLPPYPLNYGFFPL